LPKCICIPRYKYVLLSAQKLHICCFCDLKSFLPIHFISSATTDLVFVRHFWLFHWSSECNVWSSRQVVTTEMNFLLPLQRRVHPALAGFLCGWSVGSRTHYVILTLTERATISYPRHTCFQRTEASNRLEDQRWWKIYIDVLLVYLFTLYDSNKTGWPHSLAQKSHTIQLDTQLLITQIHHVWQEAVNHQSLHKSCV